MSGRRRESDFDLAPPTKKPKVCNDEIIISDDDEDVVVELDEVSRRVLLRLGVYRQCLKPLEHVRLAASEDIHIREAKRTLSKLRGINRWFATSSSYSVSYLGEGLNTLSDLLPYTQNLLKSLWVSLVPIIATSKTPAIGLLRICAGEEESVQLHQCAKLTPKQLSYRLRWECALHNYMWVFDLLGFPEIRRIKNYSKCKYIRQMVDLEPLAARLGLVEMDRTVYENLIIHLMDPFYKGSEVRPGETEPWLTHDILLEILLRIPSATMGRENMWLALATCTKTASVAREEFRQLNIMAISRMGNRAYQTLRARWNATTYESKTKVNAIGLVITPRALLRRLAGLFIEPHPENAGVWWSETRALLNYSKSAANTLADCDVYRSRRNKLYGPRSTGFLSIATDVFCGYVTTPVREILGKCSFIGYGGSSDAVRSTFRADSTNFWMWPADIVASALSVHTAGSNQGPSTHGEFWINPNLGSMVMEKADAVSFALDSDGAIADILLRRGTFVPLEEFDELPFFEQTDVNMFRRLRGTHFLGSQVKTRDANAEILALIEGGILSAESDMKIEQGINYLQRKTRHTLYAKSTPLLSMMHGGHPLSEKWFDEVLNMERPAFMPTLLGAGMQLEYWFRSQRRCFLFAWLISDLNRLLLKCSNTVIRDEADLDAPDWEQPAVPLEGDHLTPNEEVQMKAAVAKFFNDFKRLNRSKWIPGGVASERPLFNHVMVQYFAKSAPPMETKSTFQNGRTKTTYIGLTQAEIDPTAPPETLMDAPVPNPPLDPDDPNETNEFCFYPVPDGSSGRAPSDRDRPKLSVRVSIF